MEAARLLAVFALLVPSALAAQGPIQAPPTESSPQSDTALREYEDLARIRASIEAGELDRAREELGELQAQGLNALRGSESDEEALLRLKAIDGIAGDLGALHCELEVWTEIERVRVRLLPVDHPDLLSARMNLAGTRYRLGDLAGAHELFEHVHAAWERLMPDDHPHLLSAKLNLALTRKAQGDLAGARELEEYVHEAREQLLPADHPDLLRIRNNLAVTRRELGDLARALELQESVHAAWERLLPADHPDLLAAKLNLANTRKALGDLAGALELEEHVHAARERLLPADHPDLLAATQNLAATRQRLGDLAGALELEEYVHAARERLLPADHPDLLGAKQNLALTRRLLGDLRGARDLDEYVHAAWERLLPADHPDLLAAKLNLALTRESFGELAGAHELLEYVHGAWERSLPPDHPDMLATKLNLAGTRLRLGDLEGASALFEHVHEAWNRLLPPDHPGLLSVKLNLAVARRELGYLDSAHELDEYVHMTRERLLPADHPDLLLAKQSLAVARRSLGDLEGALELEERVHGTRAQRLPADHPGLLGAKQNLAITRKALGDRTGALELEEHVHRARSQQLPADHPDLLSAKLNLAWTRRSLGNLACAQELSDGIAPATLIAVERALAAAPREARAVALGARHWLVEARIWSRSDPPSGDVLHPYFSALESARFVASAASLRLLGSSDDQVGPATDEHLRVRAARAALDAHLTAGPDLPDSEDEWTDEEFLARRDSAQSEWNRGLAQLGLARDAAEKEFIRLIRSNSGGVTRIEAERLAAALGEGDVAIGLHRLDCWSWTEVEASDPPTDARYKSEYDGEHYIAYVLRSDQSIAEVDLGHADAVDNLLRQWRATIVASVDRGLGDRETALTEVKAGRRLRQALFDPLLEAAGVRPGATIFLCVDDALFSGPLDALPLDSDGPNQAVEYPHKDTPRLGDAYDLRFELSFARLLRDEVSIEGDVSVLTVGDVDFDDAALESEAVDDLLLARNLDRSLADDDRNGTWGNWPSLNGTLDEVDAIGGLARAELGVSAERIDGPDLSASLLERSVAGKRFVHIATHGWFMPESVRSMLDHDPSDERLGLLGTERTITGFAPLALCGLVLSGANAVESNEELAQRLLTAMELASFDLSACELAVLSACETNVGIARAGQGIQSLQSALHQAGARTSVTSLWRVNDYRTADLMRAFYSNLWEKKMGKADALWDAKLQLREAGRPPRHWAGWVLVGDPD